MIQMTGATKHLLLSAASGLLWGAVVTCIAFDVAPRAIWGGLIASPVIGFVIGSATKRWGPLRTSLRIPAALLSLYMAAALFGLGVGLYDWLVVDNPNRVPEAVVLQWVVWFLWGLTSGWVLLFWPLAYINHWLLGRISPADSRSHAANRSGSPE